MYLLIICLAFLMAGCELDKSTRAAPRDNPEPSVGEEPAPTPCPSYSSAIAVGTTESSEIVEASGIAASRTSDGILWVHNDSGDEPRIFALDLDGTHRGIYQLVAAEAEDWEDIALGPGPDPDLDYLYIGDIGSAGNLPIRIYRLPEPMVPLNSGDGITLVTDYEVFELTYPGNDKPDAETLMVDPLSGDLYIVTKTGDISQVFRKAAPHADGDEALLEEVATIDFESFPGNHQATGGDISADGTLTVIRTYSHAFVWLRAEGTSIASALEAEPCLTIDLVDEPQGEAIAFTSDGTGLITVSEGSHQPIYQYEP